MKKLLALLMLSVGAFAETSDNAVINNVGTGLSSAAGVGGLFMIHMTAWLPQIMFVVLFAIIVGFYFNKFEQKDRGLWKTVGALFVAIIVGYIAHYATFKALDGIWGTDCSSKIAGAYFKDIAVKGMNPSSTFGTHTAQVVNSCSGD